MLGMDTTPIALTAADLQDMIEAVAVKATAALIAQSQGGQNMRKAWAYQRPEQVQRLGADQAPWYVGYREPGGRKVGKSMGLGGKAGQRLAEREAERIHAELVTGTYGTNVSRTWAEFRAEYEAKILVTRAPNTQSLTRRCFGNFERLARPGKVSNITTKTIDGFIAARRVEKQAQHGPAKARQVSPRTVNADLRAIQAALRVAVEWGYLKESPRFRFLPVPETLPVYITPADFDLLYEACHVAYLPEVQGIPAPDWWRALLTVGYMTGLRIGELLTIRRDQVDVTAGTLKLWNQKAQREELLPLHPVVLVTLAGLRSFADVWFPWSHHRNGVWRQFNRIQRAAGLAGRYTPHALRRAFATMNAARVGAPKTLQTLMRHKDSRTVNQYYINAGEGLGAAVENLYVPPSLRTGTEG